MKKQNERRQLQSECERTCKYEYHERDCDYYRANARQGYQIADQDNAAAEPDWEAIASAETIDAEEQARTLAMVDVDKIHPHPKNPRKNLGDLTELAESIKANGIFQNLTIVPMESGCCTSCSLYIGSVEKCSEEHDVTMRPPCAKWVSAGNYTAVIGHRRLAAAKKAGMKQAPCVISDMDEKEQVRTMMVENMQRRDLSVYEEAEGFQMLLDMGDTITDIAKKTGLSDSTVRRRVKLLELDREKFQKSVNRGATLQDFMALEQIKDSDLKNRVLDAIGTANFNYELKRARDQEKEAEKKAAAIKELETFAVQIEQSEASGLKLVQWIHLHGKVEIKKPEDAGQRKYFFTVSYEITLYTEPTEEDRAEDTALQEKQKKTRERNRQLDQIAERAYQLRFDFVKGLTGLKKKIPIIYEMAVQSILLTGHQFSFNGDMLLDLLELEFDDNEEFDFPMIAEAVQSAPERVLLMAAYANMGDSVRRHYHDYCSQSKEDEALDMIYEFLERLGYEMSDEERAYQAGTHELFQKGIEEGE